jgi:hypothetical protein
MKLLFTFLQEIYNDAPEPWQIGFQDGASPGFEGITELHDSILFFLVVISVGVFWALGSVMINFNSTSSPIVYKYSNHGFKIIVTIFLSFLSFLSILLFNNSLLVLYCALEEISLHVPTQVGFYFLFSSLVPIKPADDKPSRLSNEQKAKFNLSSRQKEILIGSILGDLFIEKQKTSINPRLGFIQGIIHSDYLNHLYIEFLDLCTAGPKVYNPAPDKRTGKVYSSIRVYTYSLPCLKEYYDLFYPNGQKVVPLNIGELLTLVSLAYWLADDGFWNKVGQYVALCTESFTPAEVRLLINVLNSKWDLECYEYKRGDSYRIVIPHRSLPKLQGLLTDIMTPLMLYKIGL